MKRTELEAGVNYMVQGSNWDTPNRVVVIDGNYNRSDRGLWHGIQVGPARTGRGDIRNAALVMVLEDTGELTRDWRRSETLSARIWANSAFAVVPLAHIRCTWNEHCRRQMKQNISKRQKAKAEARSKDRRERVQALLSELSVSSSEHYRRTGDGYRGYFDGVKVLDDQLDRLEEILKGAVEEQRKSQPTQREVILLPARVGQVN